MLNGPALLFYRSRQRPQKCDVGMVRVCCCARRSAVAESLGPPRGHERFQVNRNRLACRATAASARRLGGFGGGAVCRERLVSPVMSRSAGPPDSLALRSQSVHATLLMIWVLRRLRNGDRHDPSRWQRPEPLRGRVFPQPVRFAGLCAVVLAPQRRPAPPPEDQAISDPCRHRHRHHDFMVPCRHADAAGGGDGAQLQHAAVCHRGPRSSCCTRSCAPGAGTAILVGFIGAMAILRPGSGVFEAPALLVLGSAASLSVSIALIKSCWRAPSRPKPSSPTIR